MVPAAQPTDQTGRASATCAPGGTGVVLFRGPSVFPGYLDARQNAEILTKDGWAITGDLGFISPEGHLAITGRAKDLIMRGGHNIDRPLLKKASCNIRPWRSPQRLASRMKTPRNCRSFMRS